MDDRHDENDKPRLSSTSCEDEAQLLCLKQKHPMRTTGMKGQCGFFGRANVPSPFLPLLKRNEYQGFPLLKRRLSGNDGGLAPMDDHHDENDKPRPSSTSCEDEAQLLCLDRKIPMFALPVYLCSNATSIKDFPS